MVVPLSIVIAFGASALALWIYPLVDMISNEVFTGGSRIAWLVIIVLAPVGGAIAYLSAKRYVLKYSQPESQRMERLLPKVR
ncbi:MAG: PLDc N-terminal domain-containing protein [Opitutaceae bacterium]|nr:PLDc N-terminal domain-containing protein [Opitutaceae bacterium]